MVNSSVEIETARFRLRELTEADATLRYLSWLASAEARRFIVAARQTQELYELAEYVRQRTNRPDVLFLGIFDKLSGLHIGNVKYEPVDSVQGYAVMGILIGDSNFRGKGVALEVLRSSAQWLKAHRAISQILLGVSIDNSVAIQAYKKVGFIEMDLPHIKKADPNAITMGWML